MLISAPPAFSLPEFYQLAEVPPEMEFLGNIENLGTQRIYADAVRDFMTFFGLNQAGQFRTVTRAHVIAWRQSLKTRNLSPTTIRRKLSALSALFRYLCERNAVLINPVDGVQRPKDGANEGKTPAIGDAEARRLLNAPPLNTLKGKRDRAILSLLLYHGLRRAEVATLSIEDLHTRSGVTHLRVHGKGGKIRYVPVHFDSLEKITAYLDVSGHGSDRKSSLFLPIRDAEEVKPLTAQAIYYLVKQYAAAVGIDAAACRPHALRATMATNALDHGADIAKVQEVLGHSSIATTRLYDRRSTRPQDSPVFLVKF
ncbi:MAG: tyrosine-type recombinase/integrase [Blastocatellia bacterium]|nr:tyrosine-type recombinase/integrase [Blastocatellia bacterium]